MALNDPRTIQAGTDYDAQLGFVAYSVIVSNYSDRFLFLPAVKQWCPPAVVDAVFALPAGTQHAQVQWTTPPGVFVPTFTSFVKPQFAYVMWSAQRLNPEAGMQVSLSTDVGINLTEYFNLDVATGDAGIEDLVDSSGSGEPGIPTQMRALLGMSLHFPAGPPPVEFNVIDTANHRAIWGPSGGLNSAQDYELDFHNTDLNNLSLSLGVSLRNLSGVTVHVTGSVTFRR